MSLWAPVRSKAGSFTPEPMAGASQGGWQDWRQHRAYMASLWPLPPQEQSRGRRSSTMPTVDLAVTATGSPAPAPISMPMRPNVTSTWRPSSAASMPQVSPWCVLTVLGTAGTPTPPPVPLVSWPAVPWWLSPGGSSEDGFSAIKLTALARPQFLVSAPRCQGCG